MFILIKSFPKLSLAHLNFSQIFVSQYFDSHNLFFFSMFIYFFACWYIAPNHHINDRWQFISVYDLFMTLKLFCFNLIYFQFLFFHPLCLSVYSMPSFLYWNRNKRPMCMCKWIQSTRIICIIILFFCVQYTLQHKTEWKYTTHLQ